MNANEHCSSIRTISFSDLILILKTWSSRQYSP